MGKPEKTETSADTGQSNADAPPSYNAPPTTTLSPEDINQLNLAFSSLEVPLVAKTVTAETCLAHLKLLFAFQTLKEAVGYTDGLWQIYDSRVFPAGKGTSISQDTAKLDDTTKENLSLLREKRWALYVARAAERYEAWWDSFPKNPLVEADMCEDTAKYTTFSTKPPFKDRWKVKLPPLVNDAIDTNFNYKVSLDCMATWEETTSRKWDSANDSFFKTIPPCPQCGVKNAVPWSTCGMAEDSQNTPPSLAGQGYGDGDFRTSCSHCGKILKRDYLEVFKFATDVKNLLAHERPMPGTILDSKTGMATTPGSQKDQFERTFPNRLIRYNLRSRLYDPPPTSMDAIRKIIEEALADPEVIKQVERVTIVNKRKIWRLGQEARVHVRKMMSRYWGNSSPFTLELGGAVLRQGIFTEKMFKMDWLHSPAARETMIRLIEKYNRFTEIMRQYPTQIAVPTLDVDLAWHTHQLSPASYYESMCTKTGKFIDHDDKIAEDKLSTSFEWTSKVYQEMYGEVYSECTCWYCESVRTSFSSGLAHRLPIFKSEKDKGGSYPYSAPDKFYQSGRAALCPPNNSAHISAHNSVRVTENDSIRSEVHHRIHLLHQKRLEENYEKARKRAKKKGRDLPPRDDYYYYYWGAPYLLYAPYVYPAYCVCPVYYDTTIIAAGSGYYGACAAGTCGGTIASGACGGTAAGGCGGNGGAVGVFRVAGVVAVVEEAVVAEAAEEVVVEVEVAEYLAGETGRSRQIPRLDWGTLV
ncbi:hypothetical protein EKO27_g1179 [Xylaria grammica]|uniref:Glycine-rich domain-containing protein 1 n=1 Tax=Xylaria grammica TaxID=363999 RepID=A0A439DHP0_9PEZI|nr:hypothetical protein EKO27_g1179 [Xylaria grammica]